MKFARLFLVGAVFSGFTGVQAAPPPSPPAMPDDANRFGIGSSAEWSKEYSRFESLIQQTGSGWLRLFPEWHRLQPKQGEWDWQATDDFVAAARSNHLQLTGLFYYFAPWASSGGDSRTFPVRDMQFWRDYVSGLVSRYHKDVRYWEVWNEPQAFQKNGTPQLYADMVRAAHDAAKQADPQAQIGLTVANFAVSYINTVIKVGAADHFDYLCVHPYENMEQLTRPGGEVYFLSMADNLRRMLAANKQRPNMPLWITEIGWKAPVEADAKKDALQAELMTKAYVLSFAQGFKRLFWFEARGPAYGKGTDYGIIRSDWTLRPAHTALKTMIDALSETPRYLGWLDFDGSYGFVFEGRHEKKVLVAWSPVGKPRQVKFDGPVTATDLTGQEIRLAAERDLTLTNIPVFIADVPAGLLQQAESNRDRPFPWGGDYTHAEVVSCRPGPGGLEHGITVVGETAAVAVREEPHWRLTKGGKNLTFRVNPSFASFGTTDLEIKVVARRAAADRVTGMQLFYETLGSVSGYGRAGWRTIPAGDGWHEHVWKLSDANFVGTWGYNFAITEPSGEFWVKEVSVRRILAGGR